MNRKQNRAPETEIFPWSCENVFCNQHDQCLSWVNCMACLVRARFLDFALSDRRPDQTAWGKEIRERQRAAKAAQKG